MKTLALFTIILMFLLPACNNTRDKTVLRRKPGRNEIAELNRFLLEKDRERILGFIERKNIEMKESPSGLWFSIRNEGSGTNFKEFDRIVMEFECYLLDGTKCYSSATEGPREMILGRSQLEAGLNEGLRMLKPGGEAIFILPPYLAYGIIGDNRSIPPRSIIVYEVKANIKNKERN